MLAAEREERARLQSEFDLRNCALDAAATHFMIIDVSQPRWTIVYANRASSNAHGYESAELLGQSPAMLVSEEANTVALERIAQAVLEGTSVRTELVGRRKDTSTFWLGMFMAPVRSSAGGVTHYLAIGADITPRLEQERAQRQLQDQLYSEMQERERMAIELRLAQKLESIGRLAAGIAHEINTPIQYIGDSVSFLQSTQSDLDRLLATYRAAIRQMGEQTSAPSLLAAVKETEEALDLDFLSQEIPKAFERTLQGVERVAAIVRAMKEFAHPDSAEHSSADLNHALQTTLTVAQNEYRYSAQIETRFDELPPVICDVGELNQVFLNLIVNASHAIAESGKDAAMGRIIITTSASGEDVVICIADNGCGIPANNLEKVFDPFFTTKPVGRGTGQGLAIARAIIADRHGGSIDIRSTVGSGTSFILRLPVAGRSAAKTT
ncbi:MAG: sensor protein [Gammaproteobacteria bacterium]|nr:sensor protein [Gammaproteobacteria bacterium]